MRARKLIAWSASTVPNYTRSTLGARVCIGFPLGSGFDKPFEVGFAVSGQVFAYAEAKTAKPITNWFGIDGTIQGAMPYFANFATVEGVPFSSCQVQTALHFSIDVFHSMNSDLPELQEKFRKLFEQTNNATTFEKYRLRRRLNQIRQKKLPPEELQTHLEQWITQLNSSIELRKWRQQNLPKPQLDSSLPIAIHHEKLVAAIQENQVVVVCGETGSGKSTQLPLIALLAGFGVDGMIGHTQPRRIAARSVAARVAENLGSPMGQKVGYKIRFTDETNNRTFIKLMTDGILLAETQSDPYLNQYSLLIVDEAHERSLNIDFLLGNIKRLLDRRPDLKLIITSATIDTDRFAQHFSSANERPAPVFNIEGRTYPVDIQYHPPNTRDEPVDAISIDHLVEKTLETFQNYNGDLLVFLPTEQDIRHATKRIRGELNKIGAAPADVLPLYARLTTEQQNLIFVPGKARRIVLATNVAESSVTVPRISCVIDSGTARISRYSPRRKVQRLPIEAVSQASANQRAGRCGRIGPGICIRLFDEEDFQSRAVYTTPEIRRTNLASVILQSKTLKLGPIETFPFLDPPREDAIRDGYKTLFEIGAIDHDRRLTPLGKKIGSLPVDPRIGRMLVAAHEENVLAEVLVIASALELQDPRVRPVEKREAADAQHEKFQDSKSDFISLLKIWDFYHHLKDDTSRSRLPKACSQNFLSHSLLRQWQQLHQQLKTMAEQIGLKPKAYRRLQDDVNERTMPSNTIGRGKKTQEPKTDKRYDAIHRSLLCGLLSGVAMLSDKYEYTGASGVKFRLWPGSSVFKSNPKWVIVAEIVETSQTFGRTVAAINPAWIEPIAEHLLKYQHSDPHWSAKQQTVMAHERVTLFGLPIVASRRINYGKIEPEISRSIFVEQVLAENQFDSDIECLINNQSLLEEIKDSAQRTRRRDLIVDSRTLYSFYQHRLPEAVFDFASLRRAIKEDPGVKESLTMTIDNLLDSDSEQLDYREQFPESVAIGGLKLPVSYNFSPGDDEDGASIKVPKSAISQIDSSQTPWMIPGLIQTRIEAMIRSLPKNIRRNLVPAPDTARAVAASLQPGGDFYQAVAEQLTRHAEMPIDASLFKEKSIDQHLLPNMQLIDDDGSLLAQSRSLAELRSQSGLEHNAEVQLDKADDTTGQFHRDGLKTWEWDDLPKQIDVSRGVAIVPAFPAIIDNADSVSLRLLDSQGAAERATRGGLVRLFQIANTKKIKSQVNWLPDLDRLVLAANGLCDTSQLRSLLGDLIVRVGMVEGKPICRTTADFETRNAASTENISVATQEIAKWLPLLLNNYRSAKTSIDSVPDRLGFVKADANHQIAALQSDDFLQKAPWRWLKHFPRFYQAVATRIEKMGSTPDAKEKEMIAAVAALWDRYESTAELHRQQGISDPELVEFRWMIEEYRVSLFAQKLGTSQSISPQRLDKQFKKVKNVF